MKSQSEDFTSIIIVTALIGFVIQSIIKVILLCFTANVISKKVTPMTQAITKLHSALVESLTAFFKALNYSFLFVLPGVVKMVRYYFIVFLVNDSDKYSKDELNALDACSKVSKGHVISLGLLILFFMLVTLPFSSNPSIIESPTKVFFYEPILFFLGLLQMVYSYYLFRDLITYKKMDL